MRILKITFCMSLVIVSLPAFSASMRITGKINPAPAKLQISAGYSKGGYYSDCNKSVNGEVNLGPDGTFDATISYQSTMNRWCGVIFLGQLNMVIQDAQANNLKLLPLYQFAPGYENITNDMAVTCAPGGYICEPNDPSIKNLITFDPSKSYDLQGWQINWAR